MMQMDCAQMMGGTGGTAMMIGMALTWILIIALLVLGVAALIKYLRSGRDRRSDAAEHGRAPQGTVTGER